MPFTAKIKKQAGFNSYKLTLSEMTSGKIKAIVHALRASNSSVGNNILIQLEREIENTDIVL